MQHAGEVPATKLEEKCRNITENRGNCQNSHATNNEHKLRMWSTTGKKCVFIRRNQDEIRNQMGERTKIQRVCTVHEHVATLKAK